VSSSWCLLGVFALSRIIPNMNTATPMAISHIFGLSFPCSYNAMKIAMTAIGMSSFFMTGIFDKINKVNLAAWAERIFFLIFASMEKYMLPCMNKWLFGLECPGCGTQRALMLLLRGEFTAAFTMFPAIYTTIMLFVLLGLHLFDKSRNYQRIVIVTAILNAVIMIFSYIYKMTN
jgi:hypothetical protein